MCRTKDAGGIALAVVVSIPFGVTMIVDSIARHVRLVLWKPLLHFLLVSY
jgi:hypothetical protein